MKENEPVIYFQTTWRQCMEKIGDVVCDGCGGILTPIQTVNNAGEPTHWIGCEHSLGYIECRSCRARTGNDLDIYGDSRAKWNSRKYTPEGIVETVKDSAFYNEPKAPEIYYINIKVLKERL